MLQKVCLFITLILIPMISMGQSNCTQYFQEDSLFILQKVSFQNSQEINYTFQRTPIYLFSLQYEAETLFNRLKKRGSDALKEFQSLSETQSIYSRLDKSETYENQIQKTLKEFSSLLQKISSDKEKQEYIQNLISELRAQEVFLKGVEDFLYKMDWIFKRTTELPSSTQSAFHLYRMGALKILRTFQIFKPYFLAHIQNAQALATNTPLHSNQEIIENSSHITPQKTTVLREYEEAPDYRSRLLKEVLIPHSFSNAPVETLSIVQKIEWNFSVAPSKRIKNAAYKDFIQEMRVWLKTQGLQDHILLSHNGRPNTPLTLSITQKATPQELDLFKSQFQNYFE